jgi:hypothetical protein
MDGAWNTHRKEVRTKRWYENLDLDGQIRLKWIL